MNREHGIGDVPGLPEEHVPEKQHITKHFCSGVTKLTIKA